MFLPHSARTHCSVRQETYCHWCVAHAPKNTLFKIRNGPSDYHFCNVLHAELWLEYRHKKETYRLCRMPPKERREYLAGMSMEDEISRLFCKKCDHSPS